MAQQDKNQTEDADFAKAFQELARGEQTATALETHLTALEAKIEALLAQADNPRTGAQSAQHDNSSTSDNTKSADESKP